MGGILRVEISPTIPVIYPACSPNYVTYDNMVTMTSDGGTTTEVMHRASVRQAMAMGMTVVGTLPIAEVPSCLYDYNDPTEAG